MKSNISNITWRTAAVAAINPEIIIMKLLL